MQDRFHPCHQKDQAAAQGPWIENVFHAVQWEDSARSVKLDWRKDLMSVGITRQRPECKSKALFLSIDRIVAKLILLRRNYRWLSTLGKTYNLKNKVLKSRVPSRDVNLQEEAREDSIVRPWKLRFLSKNSAWPPLTVFITLQYGSR